MVKSILLRKTVWLIVAVLAATWFIAGIELPGTTNALASSYSANYFESSFIQSAP